MFSDLFKDMAKKTPTLTLVCHCDQGTVKLRFALDTPEGRKMGMPRNVDYPTLHLFSTKVRIDITPCDLGQKKLSISMPTKETIDLFGSTHPCTETYNTILRGLCERKSYPMPDPDIPGGGGKSMTAQGQTKKPDAHSHKKHH